MGFLYVRLCLSKFVCFLCLLFLWLFFVLIKYLLITIIIVVVDTTLDALSNERERKGVNLGGWVCGRRSGRSWGRGDLNQNIFYEKIY